MNFKCPDCGGTVMFDPQSGMMKCNQCNYILYNNSFYQKDSEQDKEEGNNSVSHSRDADIKYMDINIYKCTSCGAKLMINGNESSTFCSYCGQPTVVFDRVSREQKPDYIIPFKITEEQALTLIKQKFRAGRYVPDEIKNTQIDKLRGIYIPFWLYSTYIKEQANLTGYKGRGKQKTELHFYRDVECNYRHISIDASKKLNDNISIRLEPYDMKLLKPFEPEYLSGFYADRYDVSAEEVKNIAYARTKGYMEEGIIDSCNANDISICGENVEKFSIDSIEYALLPAWFMTFWYKGELYTILVNGQTGKVVGNVPVNDTKIKVNFSVMAVLFAIMIMIFSAFMGYMFMHADGSKSGGRIFMIYMIVISSCYYFYNRWLKKYNKHNMDKERLKSSVTLGYVRERQDKTWIR